MSPDPLHLHPPRCTCAEWTGTRGGRCPRCGGVEPPRTITTTLPSALTITEWVDPVLDGIGHLSHSDYVETFWLPIVGPSAFVLLRRTTGWHAGWRDAGGYTIAADDLAAAIGMSASNLRSRFVLTWERLCRFGLAHRTAGGYAVRRVVPPLPVRHLDRLPEHLRAVHGGVNALSERTG